MDDPSEPFQQALLLASVNSPILSTNLITSILSVLVLLGCSALVSGSEVAYFALDKNDRDQLANSEDRRQKLVSDLLLRPKRLLATILITNNFVNVAIIIISTYITAAVLPHDQYLNWVVWLVEVVGITFLLLLFGEIIPKIYANSFSERFAVFMAYPLYVLRTVFNPLSTALITMSGVIDRRIEQKGHQISVDDLSYALDLTSAEESLENEEQKILQGIVNFGNTDVKQIMKPRTDVKAFEYSTKFSELLPQILDAGYSRVPVYKESFDSVVGIIYIKDLLAYLDEEEDFEWQSLIRSPFFVPESKKIDDLLDEFQQKKIHLAVVVDEYGGTSGIVTLEDVIEEIVGDITDEFDDDELVYSKLDDHNYVFEGKITLNNFYRVLDINGEEFEKQKGESDSLAGFILEIEGKIPSKNDKVRFQNIEFTIESVDEKRIKRIKATILPPEESEEETGEESNGSNGATVITIIILLASAILLGACNDDDFTPKPRGYFRIDLPEKSYQPLELECPYTFEYPEYAKIEQERGAAAHPCWINVSFPKFKGKIHLSYKDVDGNLTTLIEDSRDLTYKHIPKAAAINEQLIVNSEEKVYGLLYEVEGTGAASPYQFFLTDSTDHFLRGALYFNAVPNNDSLAPVIKFIKKDIDHLIQTMEWRE